MSVQFHGYNFGGTGSFIFSLLCILFKNNCSDFGDFQTLCGGRDREMNRGIHCKSGSSFMGLAVNAGISIWNEECSAFPH